MRIIWWHVERPTDTGTVRVLPEREVEDEPEVEQDEVHAPRCQCLPCRVREFMEMEPS